MKELLEQYWKAQDPYDLDTLVRLRHPEWVAEWPQSGELIRGHDRDRQIHESYPGGMPEHRLRRGMHGAGEWALNPMIGPLRVSEAGDFGIVEVELRYGDDSRWYAVALVEVRDGLVGREVVYFCEPFDPPAWREQWVERSSEGVPQFVSLHAGVGDEAAQRDTVAKYGGLLEEGDVERAGRTLYQDDAEEWWPQSGERVAGLGNILSVVTSHPTPPKGRVRRVSGTAGLLATEIELRYGDDEWLEVALMEFRGSRVARRTSYFARPFEAPAWRAQWVEQL